MMTRRQFKAKKHKAERKEKSHYLLLLIPIITPIIIEIIKAITTIVVALLS